MFGVKEGATLHLHPGRGDGTHAIVRPFSRTDIFYSGSVLSLAEDRDEYSLDRYRHSVVSMPRGRARLAEPRGSVIASHLSIRKENVPPEISHLKIEGTSPFLRVIKGEIR